jgi:electron transport complex protein RnfG
MAEAEGSALKTLLLVGVVAAGAAALVSASYQFSRDRIAANERARMLASLHSVLDPSVDAAGLNPIQVEAADADLLGSKKPVEAFVILDAGRPIAAILSATAPNGYNAPIQLLIGVSDAGTITGVRAVSHRETPGLGDAIDVEKSDWIRQFEGTSLEDPTPNMWAVDKDEGHFDAISGATVTSRAVVTAIKNALLYFQMHRGELFDAAIAAQSVSGAETDE